MSSSSRRRKSYDKKLKSYQNRNVVAGIVLAVAVGFAIWLMLAVMAGSTPKIYLSTNYVQYSGTQKEIPFATQSCEMLVDSLQEDFRFLESDEPLELDSDTSQLKISKNVRDEDVLLVYFNGHLVPGKDAAVEYLPAGGYEGDQRRTDFGELLGNVNESRGKIKILFIDAGRFSRSPVFPARELSDFQTPLAQAIARNDYGLGDNVWIIVSHSPNERSSVSTPLGSSLFSKAIAATVRQFRDDEAGDISVPDFYQSLREHMAGWSRNLKGNSTQTPLLMVPGYGTILDDDQSPLPSEFDQDQEKYFWKVAFTDPPQENDRNRKPDEEDTDENVFRQIQPGKQAAQRLLSQYRFDSMPLETMVALESFLELGKPVEIVNASRIEAYQEKLNLKPDRSQGKIIVEADKLNDKRKSVEDFRRAILGVAILTRFRNELMHWENDEILRYLEELSFDLPKLDTIVDAQLTRSETVPQSYTRFTKSFDDFYRSHLPLIEEVKIQIKSAADKPVTPTQAQMLGLAAERYLPLISQFEPVEDRVEVDPEAPQNKPLQRSAISFRFDLAPNKGKSRFGDLNTGLENLYNDRSGAYGSEFNNATNDTAFRFLLAAQGSEAAVNSDRFRDFSAVAPAILWKPILPKINFIRLASGAQSARVNPTDPVPVEVEIDVQAIEILELQLEPDQDAEIGRLQYSFSENSIERNSKVLFQDLKERKSVNLWFNNISFDQRDVTVPFKLKVTSNDGHDTVFRFGVTLTKEADFMLFASRRLGKAISSQRLLRWGRRDFSADVKPLFVKSLANIDSGFDFSVENRSSKQRKLRFEIYNILENECEVPSLRPDRSKGFGELSGWLAKVDATSALPEDFRLMFETKEVSLSPESDLVKLKFESADQKKGKDDKEIDLFSPQKVAHALLLVGVDADTGTKEWFQWIGFETQIAADYTANDTNEENFLRPLADILEGIELDRSFEGNRKVEIQRFLRRAWPKDLAVAELDVVSPQTGRASLNQPKLFFDGIFSNGTLAPGKVRGTEEERILVMDLWGVPGYRVLRQSNVGVVGATSRDLVGVRVDLKGTGCVSHPATWSLLNFDASGKQEQTIFLRNAPKEQGSKLLEFEFLLPAFKRDAVASEAKDFVARWNGREVKLLFPNKRIHFFKMGEAGLEFRSEVSSHRLAKIPLGNISDDSLLEIVSGPVGQSQRIGAWRFKRESLGNKPSLTLSTDRISTGNLKDVKVTADFSKIDPPIDLSGTQLLIDGIVVKQFFKRKFGESNSSGVYRFNLGDLEESVEFKIDSHRIEIAATDFFAESYAVSKTLRIEEAQKAPVVIAPKVKPKVIHWVQLKFVDQEGKAVPVAKSKIKSMRIKGLPGRINWNVSRENTGQIVAAWKGDGSVKLFNLVQGQTTFLIGVAVPGNPNIANSPDEVIELEASAEVTSQGQVVEVKFQGK